MSIPVWFKEDTVGNARACDLGVVEELKVEEKNLFAIFPIGATIQDGGKRKEAMLPDRLHVMYHVTTVMCLFIIQKEKEKRTKEKKLNQEK